MVPIMMAKLSLIPIRAGLDLSSLEAILVGAAPIGHSVMNACYDALKNHNTQFSIRQLYGMTETSTSQTMPPSDPLMFICSRISFCHAYERTQRGR